jgi:hypothetical protein
MKDYANDYAVVRETWKLVKSAEQDLDWLKENIDGYVKAMLREKVLQSVIEVLDRVKGGVNIDEMLGYAKKLNYEKRGNENAK